MAFTQVALTGKVLLSNSTPAAGATINLTLNAPITDGTTIVAPEALTTRCATDGSFTITVNANDDTTTLPTGTYYSVVIGYGTTTLDSFNVIVPHADAPTVNLFTLATLPNPNVVSPYVSQIVAGTNVSVSPAGGTGAVTVNASGGGGSSLTPTIVKTANYTAAAADFVPCDVSAGGFTVTLPTAPADKTQIGVKIIGQASTPNTLTITRGGSDVFNKVGGSTSLTLTLLFQDVILQYAATPGIWYALSTDLGNGPATGQESINVLQTPFSNVRWNTIAQSSADYFGGELQSDGTQNDEVVFQKYLQAGTYTMDLFYKTGATHGIITIFVDGVQLGTTVDTWVASGGSMLRATIAGITVTGSTVHNIRFLMATKNASATSFVGVIGGVVGLTRTGS